MNIPVSAVPYLQTEHKDSVKIPEEFNSNSAIPTRAEARVEWERKKKKGLGERALDFIGGVPDAVDYFRETWGEALDDESLWKGLFNGDPDAVSVAGKAFELGTRDVYRMAKSIASNIGEEFQDLSDDELFENYYKRVKDNANYFFKVRPEFAKQALGGKHQGDIKALADFLDPTLFIGGGAGVMSKSLNTGLRQGLKGAGKVTEYGMRTLEKGGDVLSAVGGAPLALTKKVFPNSSGMAYRGMQGMSAFAVGQAGIAGTVGTATIGFTALELTGKIARKVGREGAEIARVFAQPSGHERFLARLAKDPKVSSGMRWLAGGMSGMIGTKFYDIAFDALSAGVGAGALQTALQYATGAVTDEQAGSAFGVGALLGSPIGGIGGKRGGGKDLNALNPDGSLSKRSQEGIRNYLKQKNNAQVTKDINSLMKVSPASAVLLTTLDQVSETAGVRMNIVDGSVTQRYLEQRSGIKVPLKDLPPAIYSPDTRSMVLNRDKLKLGVEEATHTIAHELGHDHIVQMLGADPVTRRVLLEPFEDPNGTPFYFFDENGAKINSQSPIKLNDDAVAFAQEYANRIKSTDPKQAKRIMQDASLLAEEIGAEHFAFMFQDNPNAFAQFTPQFRSYLFGAVRNTLANFGIVNKKTGADAPSNAILKATQKNKSLTNLYKNFLQERKDMVENRGQDVEVGAKIKPRKGQTDGDRFTELFGGMSLDMTQVGTFTVKDQKMFDELKAQEALYGSDLDGKFAGIGQANVGQNLHPTTIDMYANSAPNPAMARQVLNYFQQIVDGRLDTTFGYRTGGKAGANGYNPFYQRNVALYGFEQSPKNPRRNKKTGKKVFPNLKVIGFNKDVVLHNIDVLAKAGLIKGDIDQFMSDFSAHSKKTFTKTGTEGRINPQGRGENELFTMAFGKDVNADSIQNPTHKAFMKDPNNGLKKSYVSYDLGALVGASVAKTDGFVFDYKHIRDNYMPSSGVGKQATVEKVNYMPLDDVNSGVSTAKIKPYPMYRPTEGNMKMETFLNKQNIFNSDKSINMDKVRKAGILKEIELAEKNGLLSITETLKAIDYDTELRGNYQQLDPRRGNGNRLKDGYEYDGSSLSVRGEKGRVGEGGDGFIDFIHYPNSPTRRRVLKTEFHGSGIKGAEGLRKNSYGELYSDRIYFGDSNYKAEQGLNTEFPHHTRIDGKNLWTGTPHYNVNQFLRDFEDFVKDSGINEVGNGEVGNTVGKGRQTAFETFVKNQGFLGIYAPKDNVGFMFHDIEVGSVGKPTVISYEPAFVPEGRKLNYMPKGDEIVRPPRPEKVVKDDRSPQLRLKARGINEGQITPEEYAQGVDNLRPVDQLTEKDIVPATRSKMLDALAGDRKKGRLGKGKHIKKGTRVGLRLDIPAYTSKGVWIPTIHNTKKQPIAHESVAVIDNVIFEESLGDALGVALGKQKSPFAQIMGDWNPTSKQDAIALAETALKNEQGNWTQVGFDPTRHSYFYDRGNHRQALESSSQVVQVGRAVFAKDAVFKQRKQGEQYYMPDQADGHIKLFEKDVRINKIALDELNPEQKKLLANNHDKNPSELLGKEWDDLIKWATLHESVEPKIKALEGDKNAVESKLTMEDYTDNTQQGSVALSARMGIVNKNKKGMFPSYKAVTKLLHQLVNKIEYTMQKYPDFAKRTASFYSDMGRTALQMANIARVPNRTLFDVADLQLRFLALGSPRSAVSANMTKSARSLMSPHGAPSGHKINPTDQQIASSRTAIDWDNGKHFEVMDEKAIGASDKVRNFYLNGLSELVTIAKQEGTQADVDALLNKAGITLGVIKPNEILSPEQTVFLDKTLDGLATVDMWDMAGKGYAHPAFVFEKNRTNLQKKNAFHWSVEKHRVRKDMNPSPSSQWARAMREIGIKDASELNHQQANALQIDGFKYWNEDTWADRSIQGFEKDAQGKYPEFSFYRVADEDGLTPKGGGALYDAHQTVDGLLADTLNARGYAEFFGKDKLLARNAQEILWALTKLDNPLPSNQNLVLFGDRFKDLNDSVNELRKNGSWVEKKLPKSAQAILGAINDTYSKTFTQNLPFEVTTYGKSKEAQAVQAQEAKMGVNDLTMSVAKNLGDEIQSIADNRQVPILIEEVKVCHGGYTEDGVTVTSPNITIALRGDPKDTATVMVEISRALDQADGNVFRKPTLKEINSGATLNEAVVFNTQGFTQKQKADFFTDLSKLQDSDGDTFLTGFTDSKQGMFIADLYYKPDRLNSEVKNNISAIEKIMDSHGVTEINFDVMIADKYSRPDPENAVQFSKDTARTSFGRDIFTLLKHKVKSAQGRKFDGLPEVLDREQRIIDQAYRASKGDYISSKQRDDAKATVKEGVDLMTIEGMLDKDGNKRLKEEINVMFAGKYKPVKRKGKELNKKLFKRASDPKAKITQTQKKNLLWAFRPQDKGFESGSLYFQEKAWNKQAEALLGDQKKMELNSPKSRKSYGIKKNSYFNKPSKTGTIIK